MLDRRTTQRTLENEFENEYESYQISTGQP